MNNCVIVRNKRNSVTNVVTNVVANVVCNDDDFLMEQSIYLIMYPIE